MVLTHRVHSPARADGQGYEQDAFLHPDPSFARVRSNSYDSAPARSNELGPLARIPSPDPDHIDGLHKHGAHGSANGQSASNSGTGTGAFIPPLSFESNGLSLEPAHKDATDTGSMNSSTTEKGLFTHPNSSAPALSTMFSAAHPPTLSQRSATAPTKRLAFASNLSVYDTFPATVYDRRSEPATWSRLTPALAQRIKEELNSYKMEEMEVHAASRVQCVYPSCTRRLLTNRDLFSVQHTIFRLMLSGVEMASGSLFLVLFAFLVRFCSTVLTVPCAVPVHFHSLAHPLPVVGPRTTTRTYSCLRAFWIRYSRFSISSQVIVYPHQCPMCNTMTHRVRPIPTYMYAVPYLFASTSLAPLHSYGPCMAVCAS